MEVSVVIPNFNGIAFLDSVLASLEGQTLSNFEVILVDNGSTDGSCSFRDSQLSVGTPDRAVGEFWILRSGQCRVYVRQKHRMFCF